MATLITSDTAWKIGQVINLTGDVQIDHGVTLTIEPGVVINGNGYKIQVYGKLDVNGQASQHVKANNVDFEYGSSSTTPGVIELNYVDAVGGKFLESTGYGSFEVQNSFFSGVKGFYIWYPTAPSSFVGNIFNKSSGLSIGTNGSGTLLIQNNSFSEQTTGYAIESWANYNNGINVTGNSFLSTDRVAIAIREGYFPASVSARDNYFGTSNLAVIDAMILDRKDSLNRSSVVSIDSVATAPNVNVPNFNLGYVPSLLTAPSNQALILIKDTAWKTGQVINLTGDVQIDHGVTLTIEPGVVINGNGYKIQVYGKLDVNGQASQHVKANNVDFEYGSSSTTPGVIELNYVDAVGGKFLESTGYGSFEVQNSFFSGVKGFYIWYPTAPSSFVGNIFNKSSGLSIGTNGSGTLLIQNNSFSEQTTGYAIESWANYNNGINVTGNSFLSTDRVAIAIREGYFPASVSATDNYFGTSNLAVIDAMILDRKDSLNRSSIVSIDSLASNASSNTPQNFLTGQIYHWKSHELLPGVSTQIGALDNFTVSNEAGVFFVSGLTIGIAAVKTSLAITDIEKGSVINSADALAALKIAVGRSPNADGSPASPYQLIAADVNQDGKVTSADALAILKMAVKRSDALAREWLFVKESQDFWDESANNGQGGYTISRTNVTWNKDLQATVTQDTTMNLIAVLKGDVNGSWTGATTGTQNLPNTYFSDLVKKGLGPLSTWGVVAA